MNFAIPIRVLLAEDCEPVRRSIRNFLQDFKHILVVREASNYQDMMEIVMALKPDVVLFDLHVPGENEIDLVAIRKLVEAKCALVCISFWIDEEAMKFTSELECPLIDKTDMGNQLVPIIEAAVKIQNGFAGLTPATYLM